MIMSVADFYNRVSPFYHLIYPDRDAGAQRQSFELDCIFREVWNAALIRLRV
jgi:hypothetical protein